MVSAKSFNDLPDELLLEIFSYFSIEDLAMSVQHVNTHWKGIALDETFWKTRVFSPENSMSDKDMASHLKNMPLLKSFCLNRGIKAEVIDIMCEACKDIEHLKFYYSQRLNNSRLKTILQTFPNLVSFTLTLPIEKDQLEFSKLLAEFHNLSTLDFNEKSISEVSGGLLAAIAEGCPYLQHLDLGCTRFQDVDVKYFLKKRGHQLLSLSVRSYISTVTHNMLCDCRNLEYLRYEHCNEDLPGTYMQHLSNLSNLQSLSLCYFSKSQTENIPKIFQKHLLSKLIKLTIIYCEGFDNDTLSGIFRNCPQLQFFTLRCEKQLTDVAFKIIGNCKNLQHLSVECCPKLTDKCMEYIGAGCHNLLHLDLEYSTEVTNKGIEHICAGCTRLKFLNISMCSKLTDAVFEIIFKCKDLRVLNLMYNSKLLGTFFYKIPTILVNLTELHIEGCYKLDTKCLDDLREEMPQLKIIGRHKDIEEEFDIDLENIFLTQLL